jgi:hypothetical protein
VTDKKQPKAKTPRKGSIMATVIGILGATSVPGDEAIIAKVRTTHKGTKFDEKHLAWYKSQFRQGKLTGQGKGPHAIAQKPEPKKQEPRRDKSAPKASTAKSVGLKPKKKMVEAPVEAMA